MFKFIIEDLEVVVSTKLAWYGVKSKKDDLLIM